MKLSTFIVKSMNLGVQNLTTGLNAFYSQICQKLPEKEEDFSEEDYHAVFALKQDRNKWVFDDNSSLEFCDIIDMIFDKS